MRRWPALWSRSLPTSSSATDGTISSRLSVKRTSRAYPIRWSYMSCSWPVRRHPRRLCVGRENRQIIKGGRSALEGALDSAGARPRRWGHRRRVGSWRCPGAGGSSSPRIRAPRRVHAGVFAQSPEYRAIEGGAAVDSDITVEFSGLIDPATATNSTVQLLGPGGAPVPIEVSASEDASAVDITPLSPLTYTTRYRIVLTDALRSSSGGDIRLPRGGGPPEDFLSFMTQPLPPDPPVLTSTEPADGSTGADGGSPVFATFSKPMNPLTLNSATVMLITQSGDRVASGLTCCGEDDGTLRVDPVEPLAAGLYRLVLGDGVTDVGGLPMLPDTFGFRVGVEARPIAPSGPGRLTIQVIPASVASRTIVVIDGETLGPAPSRAEWFRRGLPTGLRFSARPSSPPAPSASSMPARRCLPPNNSL